MGLINIFVYGFAIIGLFVFGKSLYRLYWYFRMITQVDDVDLAKGEKDE